MNTKELIEIARECCSYPVKVSDYHWCGEGEFIFTEAGLNAFAQRIEQRQWQRIETAPKDGTRIMLWEQYSDAPFVGWWLAVSGQWTASHEHVDAVGGWEGAIVVDRIEQKFITHWMPLPKLPEQSQ